MCVHSACLLCHFVNKQMPNISPRVCTTHHLRVGYFAFPIWFVWALLNWWGCGEQRTTSLRVPTWISSLELYLCFTAGSFFGMQVYMCVCVCVAMYLYITVYISSYDYNVLVKLRTNKH
jgi:hypothetical protein